MDSHASAWWPKGALIRYTFLAILATPLAGCHAIRNGWLDPTIVGNFSDAASLEIRTSLTLEDTPPGIPGSAYPSPEDLVVEDIDYRITIGDTLAIEIYELRQRGLPYQTQTLVGPTGDVNLPSVGRIVAVGLTVAEFERAVIQSLQDGDILVDPDVTINPIFLQESTYSIFGVGVSAATNAPLRAGTFPIRRPDLRLLEAINQVGGLNEFVTDVFVFRSYVPRNPGVDDVPLDYRSPSPTEESNGAGDTAEPSPTDAIIDAVVADDPTGQTQTDDKVPGDLEPEAPPPYVFVDGEFVENPGHEGRSGPATAVPAIPIDTVTPAVNWARIAGDTQMRVLRIPAEQLRSGDPNMNVVIRPGDVIRIVSGEIGVYYVMGQVNRVGPFAFNAESITLKSAIAAAGGLSTLAWPDRCTVYRRIGRREQMIQVDLDRIFAGKDEDFLIRRGDIINVGTHPLAPFLRSARNMSIPNPVSNVGYSFTYARNFADIDSFSVRTNPHNEPDRFPALFP